jgi:uncharacterized LabA/DUF88 family protein
MTRVVAYAHGFNLYFGLKAGYGRRYHWLDLQVLVTSLLQPGQELREVLYFTARVKNDPDAALRQSTYLDALAAHCQRVYRVEGRFQEKPRVCNSCGASWTGYEEKETDLNIATALIEDAVEDRYDTAILVTGDSDLRPAVAAVKRLRPGKRIIAAFPPGRHSRVLVRAVDAYIPISHTKVRNAQLPSIIFAKGGVRLTRPAYWS